MPGKRVDTQIPRKLKPKLHRNYIWIICYLTPYLQPRAGSKRFIFLNGI